MSKNPKIKLNENKLGDFYWAYADILRGIGVNETVYDQRILAFMALKLLVDNNKLQFNFDWRNNFGLSTKQYKKYEAENTLKTFLNIIADIEDLGKNLLYFIQPSHMTPIQDTISESIDDNCLKYLNHKKTFTLSEYIEELEEPHYLEMVLDIYISKAHFVGYPSEKYKDLYIEIINKEYGRKFKVKDNISAIKEQDKKDANKLHLKDEFYEKVEKL
jgi:type I restriction enzyme M protein